MRTVVQVVFKGHIYLSKAKVNAFNANLGAKNAQKDLLVILVLMDINWFLIIVK